MEDKIFKVDGQKACTKVLAGIRLTPKQHQELRKLADKNKISMQEVVRQMVSYCLGEETRVTM